MLIVKSRIKKMKILCVLYDDPKEGMPKSYPLSSLPKLTKYPDGTENVQTFNNDNR